MSLSDIRSSILATLVVGAAACGGSPSGGGEAGPIVVPSGSDAAVDGRAEGVPDAHAAGQPDARPVPDAPVGAPDGHSTPDARPGTPDARPVADAAPPDAAPPPCTGTWTAIPPLVIGQTTITPIAVASLGQTLYYLYQRPGTTTFYDVARYAPGTGWRAAQSQNALDFKFQNEFIAKSDHIIVYYYSTDASKMQMRRGVLHFSDETWDVTDPFPSNQSQGFTPYAHLGFPAITDDYLVWYGEFDDYNDPNTGLFVCSSVGETYVFPVDDPATGAPATMPTASPLGRRDTMTVAGVGHQAFFFGGEQYEYPPQPGDCDISGPTRLNDGAFYAPATGIWGVVLSIEPITHPHDANPHAPLALARPDGVVLLEDTDLGANGVGRYHFAAPDTAGFQTVDLPKSLYLVWPLSGDAPTLGGVASGFVVWRGNAGYLFDAGTGMATTLCAPPAAFPVITGVNYGGYAGPTDDGAVLVRGPVAAYLHL